MDKEEGSVRADIRRITIDEKLAGDLIRAAVCRLAEGVDAFYDRQGDWGRERGAWLRPGDYARKMGLKPDQAPAWDSLKEGQVFLVGEFAVVGERAKPTCFEANRGERDVVRIDSLKEYRDGVKHFYAYLLEQGGRHGESHQA